MWHAQQMQIKQCFKSPSEMAPLHSEKLRMDQFGGNTTRERLTTVTEIAVREKKSRCITKERKKTSTVESGI